MTRQDVSTGQPEEVFDAEAMTKTQFDALALKLAQPHNLPDQLAAVLAYNEVDQGVYLTRFDHLPCLEFRLSGTLRVSGGVNKRMRQAGKYVDTGYCLESELVQSADGPQTEHMATRNQQPRSANDGRLFDNRRILIELHGQDQCFAARIKDGSKEKGESVHFFT